MLSCTSIFFVLNVLKILTAEVISFYTLLFFLSAPGKTEGQPVKHDTSLDNCRRIWKMGNRKYKRKE